MTVARAVRIVATMAIAGRLVLGVAFVIVLAQARANFDVSSKTAPRYAYTGDRVTYTILVAKTGEPISDVVLTNPIPYGAIVIPSSCTYQRESGPAQAATRQTCGRRISTEATGSQPASV